MKSFLLYEDRGLDAGPEHPAAASTARDLEIDTVLRAMSGGDEFLLSVARSVLLTCVTAPEDVLYRQEILADCIRNPGIITDLYSTVAGAVRDDRQIHRSMFTSAGYVLYEADRALRYYAGVLHQLRSFADLHAAAFTSRGLARLCEMLRSELDEAYFAAVEEHLRRLRFRDGVLLSARLGRGNVGADYVLRKPEDRKGLLGRLQPQRRPGYVLTVADRDETGHRTLSELTDRGINLVANALAQSAEHIISFLTVLRRELGFYVSCLRLRDELAGQGQPTCFPVPLATDKQALSADGLYDPSLALTARHRVVGNDVRADGKSLVFITGANQGGKSTFLRSVGLAQLMMQSGMFVAAKSFSASVCAGVFTHYKREEDATMTSGKLDEELRRMSEIVDHVVPGSLLLCNESFASTNEREGSEIARHIVSAMAESGVRVLFVTHFFDLAERFYRQNHAHALFLRADRQASGQRTFRLTEGAPERTSHARDIYESAFPALQPPEPQNSCPARRLGGCQSAPSR